VFSAEINSYRGNENTQLVIKDVRWAKCEEQADREAWAVYRAFTAGEVIDREGAALLAPTREELVAVFRHVKANAEDRLVSAPAATLYRKVRYETKACGRMNVGKLLICLDIFRECGIFDYEISDEDVNIRIMNYQGKADVNGSTVLKTLMAILKG